MSPAAIATYFRRSDAFGAGGGGAGIFGAMLSRYSAAFCLDNALGCIPRLFICFFMLTRRGCGGCCGCGGMYFADGDGPHDGVSGDDARNVSLVSEGALVMGGGAG